MRIILQQLLILVNYSPGQARGPKGTEAAKRNAFFHWCLIALQGKIGVWQADSIRGWSPFRRP